LGGPYEDNVDGCVGGGAADPPTTWHILTASISQLPAGAGNNCMLEKSGVPGACVLLLLLEHDAMLIATAADSAILAVSFDP
jgi:hypothetical protein